MTDFDGITEDDQARIVAYLDGELEEHEMFQLDLRMAEDPELAAAFEAFSAMDRWARRQNGATAIATAPPRRRWMLAAVLLVGLGCWYWILGPGARRVVRSQSAVLAADATLEEYAARLDLDPRTTAEIRRLMAKGPEAPRMSEAEIFAALQGAEADRREQAYAAQKAPLVAGYYLVSFQPAMACSALVVEIDRQGQAVLRYPAASAPARRFEAGIDHALPGPSVELDPVAAPGERLRWRRGYLLPIGSRRVTVLLALRQTALELAVLEELAERLASPRASPEATTGVLEDWLAAHGFAVTRFDVREP